MARYKVGDDVLVKGEIVDGLDEDGDYYVSIKFGEGDCEHHYINERYIFGRVSDFDRKEKYMVGDVLDNSGSICVISSLNMENKRAIVTYSDGSGGYRDFSDLDTYFTHTGKNIYTELDTVLSHLKGA